MQLIYCDKKQASGCLEMGKKGWKKWQQDYKTAGENFWGRWIYSLLSYYQYYSNDFMTIYMC